MDHRLHAEYQHFLVAFHEQHGFLQPPNFQEWLISMSYHQNIINRPRFVLNTVNNNENVSKNERIVHQPIIQQGKRQQMHGQSDQKLKQKFWFTF